MSVTDYDHILEEFDAAVAQRTAEFDARIRLSDDPVTVLSAPVLFSHEALEDGPLGATWDELLKNMYPAAFDQTYTPPTRRESWVRRIRHAWAALHDDTYYCAE